MTDGPRGSAPPTLAALLADLAASLAEARFAQAGGRMEWSRQGVTFATLEGDRLEVRLDGPVAAAALKTPDTDGSSRGMPWVSFAPRELDGHALDRAGAWFGLAYRRAVAT